MANSCNSKRVGKIILWTSIPVLIASLAMLPVFNLIYNSKLKKDITLGEGTLASKVWEDIPLPIYEKLYFFNITNQDDFLNGKPLNVSEVGPYTYKAKWVKNYRRWNPNNTVSYREVRTYHFVPEMSNGSEDDKIYTLNAPMILASDNVKDDNILIRGALWAFLSLYDEDLIMEKSIRELVYEGYDDMIIKDAKYLRKDLPYKDGKFSWLYGKNASDDGLFTVFTGTDDASKTNFINNWNGQEKLNFWKGDTCNLLNGTSIETGPPIDDHQDSYTFFQTIFCRSLTFNYDKDTIHYDLDAKRFRPNKEVLANGTENPDNRCFEIKGERPSGILDISPCQFGAPVFLSFPHFYLADSFYLEDINGLSPNDQDHGSYIDIEPLTGLSIDLSMKFQININVIKVSPIGQFENVKDGLYPVFWAELSLNLDENMADYLKTKVRRPKVIAYAVLISVAGLCLLLIIASAILIRSYNKDDQDRFLIKKSSNEHSSDGAHQYPRDDFPREEIKKNTTSGQDNLETYCKESSGSSGKLYPNLV